MKTYNFIEALNEPIGTEFNIINAKKGAGYSQKAKVVGCGQIKLLRDENREEISANSYTVNLQFRKIRKPLTFFEAMKLADEGKKVTNVLIGGYYSKNKDNILVYREGFTSSIEIEQLETTWYEYED